MKTSENNTIETPKRFWSTIIDYLKKGGESYPLLSLRLLFGVFVVFSVVLLFAQPPRDFPTSTMLNVKKGTTLNQVSQQLKSNSLIRSEFLFKTFTVIFGGQDKILSGDYFFEKPSNLFSITKRLMQGVYGLTPVRVTFPEGTTIYEIAQIMSRTLPSFSKEDFLDYAREKEGYLFPDTYFFLPNVSPEQVVKEMERNFTKKISALQERIEQSQKSLEDIVIMASILEEEAISLEDKKIVAGILWKRMDVGMFLQVDAPFIYERNKNTFELTIKDLRKDTPYNTYTNKGLPPTAISNPGLDSIIAALSPTKTVYYFYLSDKNSNMHYAENYEKHIFFKRKYLD